MSGELDLKVLISSMKPRLREGEFVFCTTDEETYSNLKVIPVATFREAEGISLVLSAPAAKLVDLRCDYTAKMIVLDIHSSLYAVGFIAVIAGRLAQEGISANPVSAYFHDYLFVPTDQAVDAMRILEEMTKDPA